MRGAYVCSGARLEGVTLCDGRSRVDPQQSISETLGGGLFAESGATIVDCVISNNGALNGGGSCGWGTFERCTFADNSSAFSGGGALYGYFRNCMIGPGNESHYGAGLSQAEVDCSLIQENWASEAGGGAYDSTIRRSRIEGNDSSLGGGGLSSCTAENCLVLFNRAWSGNGGGARGTTIRNCVLRGNDASASGGGADGCYIRSSIIWWNYAATLDNVSLGLGSLDYSCTTPDPGGTENTTNDPQFVDIDSDWHLLSISPCIDKGDPLSTVSNDYDGVWRPLDGNGDGTNRVDMGAYEFATTNVDLDSDGLSDSLEVYTYGSDPHATDTDGDTQGDGEEVIAGSNPTNAASFFQTGTLAPNLTGAGYVLSWDGLTGRVYTLREVFPIAGLWSNVAGYASYTGTGARVSYTNPAPSDVQFHSLRVQRTP